METHSASDGSNPRTVLPGATAGPTPRVGILALQDGEDVNRGYQDFPSDVNLLRAVLLQPHTTAVDVTGRVRAVLENAEEPLSTGTIQCRVAREGLDVATSAIRAACEELLEAGEIAAVGEEPREQYRAVD